MLHTYQFWKHSVLIMRLCSLQPTFSTSMLCKERSRLHLLLCPAQSINISMHALHRKCCTRISSGSRSKSCAHYVFMQFATNIQYKHALQRKKHTSIKVQEPYLKCCCKACAWNRWYCFNVRRMHLELRVYLSLTTECTLPCIALIYVMLSTLQCNIIWIAYTPLESVQIQEALTSLMSFTCCL